MTGSASVTSATARAAENALSRTPTNSSTARTAGMTAIVAAMAMTRLASGIWPLNTSLWVKDYKRATPLYAFQFLSLIDLAGFNAGSAVPTLNRNHVHGLPSILPPRDVVLAFDLVADGLMQKHRQNEAESETLAQTRDLLLPRLMSGELRVADVDGQKAKHA